MGYAAAVIGLSRAWLGLGSEPSVCLAQTAFSRKGINFLTVSMPGFDVVPCRIFMRVVNGTSQESDRALKSA